MKLTFLDASFVRHGGEDVTDIDGNPVPERRGVGLAFDCPGGCGGRHMVPFANPLDGGPEVTGRPDGGWQRTGDTIETLTLTPSIQLRGPCTWHGWIRNGEAVNA